MATGRLRANRGLCGVTAGPTTFVSVTSHFRNPTSDMDQDLSARADAVFARITNLKDSL